MPLAASPDGTRAKQNQARAAELKAQLIARRESQSTSIDPSPAMQKQTAIAQDGASPSTSGHQNSPHTPASSFEQEHKEHHIDELISQYSGPSSTANTNIGQDAARANPVLAHPCPVPGLTNPSKSVATLLVNASKVTNPGADGSTSSTAPQCKNPRGAGEARTQNLPNPQPSEGAHPSLPAPARHPLPSKPKQALVSAARTHSRPQTPLLQGALAYRPPSRMSVPTQRSPSIATTRDGPTQHLQPSSRGDGNNNQTARPDSHSHPNPQAESQHQDNNEGRNPASTSNNGPDKASIEAPRVPTLAELLILDRDLNDWLQITNYFSLAHRGTVLNRRRAILELDEQRRKLLAEIEADEQGPILLAPRTQLKHVQEKGDENMNMDGFEHEHEGPERDVKMEFLEAQTLAKIEAAKAEAAAIVEAAKVQAAKVQAASIEAANAETAELPPRRQNNRVASNKRTYSDEDDPDSRPKIQRTMSIRRPSPRYDSYRPSPPPYDNHPLSPNWRPFSPPIRGGRARSPDRSRYHDEPRFPSPRRLRSCDRRGPERPPFAERGAYHCRGYDPDSRRYHRAQRRRRSPTPPPPPARRRAAAVLDDGKVPFDCPPAPRGDLGSRITRGRRGY